MAFVILLETSRTYHGYYFIVDQLEKVDLKLQVQAMYFCALQCAAHCTSLYLPLVGEVFCYLSYLFTYFRTAGGSRSETNLLINTKNVRFQVALCVFAACAAHAHCIFHSGKLTLISTLLSSYERFTRQYYYY